MTRVPAAPVVAGGATKLHVHERLSSIVVAVTELHREVLRKIATEFGAKPESRRGVVRAGRRHLLDEHDDRPDHMKNTTEVVLERTYLLIRKGAR